MGGENEFSPQGLIRRYRRVSYFFLLPAFAFAAGLAAGFTAVFLAASFFTGAFFAGALADDFAGAFLVVATENPPFHPQSRKLRNWIEITAHTFVIGYCLDYGNGFGASTLFCEFFANLYKCFRE